MLRARILLIHARKLFFVLVKFCRVFYPNNRLQFPRASPVQTPGAFNCTSSSKSGGSKTFRLTGIDNQFRTVNRMRSLPDFIQFLVIIRTPSIHNAVQTFIFELFGFGKFAVVQIGESETSASKSTPVKFSNALCVSDDMHAAAHEQVADRSACRRFADHFIHAHFIGACAAF